MIEIWKYIEGYGNKYQVSTLGNVKSVLSNRQLKKCTDKYGYHIVNLSFHDIHKSCKVHRLVASAFLEDYSNDLQVNHKNENKTDNRVENLEMWDNKYNCSYGTHRTRLAKTVIQETLQGEFIKEWESTREIERIFGYSNVSISGCCRGFLKDSHSGKVHPVNQAYGYKWKYKQ